MLKCCVDPGLKTDPTVQTGGAYGLYATPCRSESSTNKEVDTQKLMFRGEGDDRLMVRPMHLSVC